jgi:hypothetical protein
MAKTLSPSGGGPAHRDAVKEQALEQENDHAYSGAASGRFEEVHSEYLTEEQLTKSSPPNVRRPEKDRTIRRGKLMALSNTIRGQSGSNTKTQETDS